MKMSRRSLAPSLPGARAGHALLDQAEAGEPDFHQLEPDGRLVEADRGASRRRVSPRDGCCVLP